MIEESPGTAHAALYSMEERLSLLQQPAASLQFGAITSAEPQAARIPSTSGALRSCVSAPAPATAQARTTSELRITLEWRLLLTLSSTLPYVNASTVSLCLLKKSQVAQVFGSADGTLVRDEVLPAKHGNRKPGDFDGNLIPPGFAE